MQDFQPQDFQPQSFPNFSGSAGNNPTNPLQFRSQPLRSQLFAVSGSTIIGTERPDRLQGTAGDDVIIGKGGPDILTGGLGNDRFIYEKLSDAGDIIQDFTVGQDVLDFTSVLATVGYTGSNPLGDGYIQLQTTTSGTLVKLDRDGAAGPNLGVSYLIVRGVSVAQLNNPTNFLPRNQSPIANNDSGSGFTTNEDTPFTTASVLTNDSDPDGNPLAVSAVNTTGTQGLVTNNNNGTFTYNPNGKFDALKPGQTATDSFGYSISDGKGGTASATVTVTITGVNDGPAIATNTGATVNEGSSVLITTANLNEGDPDDSGAELTYTITTGPARGFLERTTNPGNSITSFTQAEIDSGLVRYVHDGSETSNDSFGFSLADGGENGAAPTTGTFNITVNPVNDAPVNGVPLLTQTTNTTTPLVFGSANNNLISISDVDAGTNPIQVTLSVDNGTLTLASLAGLNFTVGDGNTDTTMTFTGAIAAINTALNGLSFSRNSAGISILTITTNDQGNSGAGGPKTDTDTVTIDVTSSNTPPSLDLDLSGAGTGFSTTFTEGGAAVAIADTDITITDPDAGAQIQSATISLTTNPDGLAESLSVNGALPAGITATVTATQVVLTGAASLASYQTALGQIRYTNTSVNPTTTSRSVTVVVNDGQANSNVAATTIAITAINNPPVKAAPSYSANANLTLIVADGGGDGAGGILDLLDGATDPEGTTVSVVAGTFTSAAAAATATTADDNNVTINADGSFTYRAVAGFVGNDTFTYQIRDNGSPLPAVTTNVTATITLTTLNGSTTGTNPILWFIDEDATTSTNLGTQANPFRTLAAFNTANTGVGNNPAAGDVILLDEDTTNANGDGTNTYVGGITLLNNQSLIGDGSTSTLATLTGIALGSFNTFNSFPGTAFSGNAPTITNASGNGITLASGNTIRGVRVANSSGSGISGNSVNGLTITETQVVNNGGTTGHGLVIASLNGTASITNSQFTTNAVDGVNITNTGGTLTSLTLTGNTFTGDRTAPENNGFTFTGQGSSTSTLTITNNTFTNHNQNGLSIIKQGASAITTTISSNTFNNNRLNSINAESANGSSGTFNGTISNNVIGTSGVANSGGAIGIRVFNTGNTTANFSITNNTILNYLGNGISAIGSGASGNTGTSRFTITGNSATHPNNAADDSGIVVTAGASHTVRATITGNTSQGNGTLFPEAIFFDEVGVGAVGILLSSLGGTAAQRLNADNTIIGTAAAAAGAASGVAVSPS